MEIGVGIWFEFSGLLSEEGPVGPERAAAAAAGVVGLFLGRFVAFGVGLFGRAFNSDLAHARDFGRSGFLGFNSGGVFLAHEHWA